MAKQTSSSLPELKTEIQKDVYSESLEKGLKQTVEGETEAERMRYAKKIKRLILKDRKKLMELALVDPLTGAYNRGYFEDAITKLESREKRNKSDNKAVEPFSVLMIDLDHFKAVNDSFGHPVGDEVLKEVVKIMNEKGIVIARRTVAKYRSELNILPSTLRKVY